MLSPSTVTRDNRKNYNKEGIVKLVMLPLQQQFSFLSVLKSNKLRMPALSWRTETAFVYTLNTMQNY